MDPNAHRIRVAVEYADPLVAIGLSTVLSQQVDIDVVGRRDGDERFACTGDAQVVVTDYSGGLQRAAEGRRRDPLRERPRDPARVLVVTPHEREHEVRSALEAGVDGYIQLGCKVAELVCGVRQLARGARYISATAARRIADSMTRSALTQRELDVLRLVVHGKSNKLIALELDICVGTVKAHMKAILGKLDARTRTQAASVAVERGLVAWAAAA